MRSESTTRAPPSSSLSVRRAEDAELRRRGLPLGQLFEGNLLSEEDTGLAELDKARTIIGLISPPPGASFLQVRRDLLVAASFLMRFGSAENARSGIDRGATAEAGGSSGGWYELDSVAFRPPSARTLTSLAYLGHATLAQTTPVSGTTEENRPAVASGQRDLEPDGKLGPSFFLSTKAAASTEPPLGYEAWQYRFSGRYLEQRKTSKAFCASGANARIRFCQCRAKHFGTISRKIGQEPQSELSQASRAAYTERIRSKGDSQYCQ